MKELNRVHRNMIEQVKHQTEQTQHLVLFLLTFFCGVTSIFCPTLNNNISGSIVIITILNTCIALCPRHFCKWLKILTHLTYWLMAWLAPELKVYYPYLSNSMHYCLAPLTPSHTHRLPLFPISFSLQLRPVWMSSISVWSVVVMADLFLGHCFCPCMCPAQFSHSLLLSPYLVFPKIAQLQQWSTFSGSQSYQYPAGKKDDYCRDMGSKVGSGDFKITQRDKLGHTSFLTYF